MVTVRTGGAEPDAVTALWKDGLLARLDLEPLSVDTVRSMVEDCLGGPVDARSAQRFWNLTGGNALFLRQLLKDQVDVDLQQLFGRSGIGDVVDFCCSCCRRCWRPSAAARPSASRSTATPRSSGGATPTRCCPASWRTTTRCSRSRRCPTTCSTTATSGQHEVSRPLHYILVDGSASMRGAREVFARGLALALAKKLSLVGGSRRRLAALLRQPAAPRIDLGRAARRDLPRSAVLSLGARAQLRARVRGPAVESSLVRDDSAARSRSRSSPTAPATSRAPPSRRWRAGPRVRRLRAAVAAAGAGLPAAAWPLPGGHRRVAGAARRHAAPGAGDRGRRHPAVTAEAQIGEVGMSIPPAAASARLVWRRGTRPSAFHVGEECARRAWRSGHSCSRGRSTSCIGRCSASGSAPRADRRSVAGGVPGDVGPPVALRSEPGRCGHGSSASRSG